ncbi:unnamed protein product [Echinostoma caproni]|uniref:Uncharacterized protein n=1 Tax=Echinostoma caproni TaxID=27848 RepID=A0A183A3K1_9TREM|nr:unnamed protein product [Echinostoma caproni]
MRQLSRLFFRLNAPLTNGFWRVFSDKPSFGDEGFTRSIYCKPQVFLKVMEVNRNGQTVQIRTGLIDPKTEPLGDQFTKLHIKLTYKHDLDMIRVKERNKRRQMYENVIPLHFSVERWFQRYAGLPPGLPKRFVGDLKIESIDLSGTNVVYEGFELLRKWLIPVSFLMVTTLLADGRYAMLIQSRIVHSKVLFRIQLLASSVRRKLKKFLI